MAKTEYIKREDALFAFTGWIHMYRDTNLPDGIVKFIEGITARVQCITAADVAEVKHGRWIDDCCSLCGQYVWKGDPRNYCPNCGAKMKDG